VHERDEVLAAAQARAAALAAGDAAALRELLHPGFGWVSHRGETFDRDRYIAANTGAGGTRWREQRLTDVDIEVVAATAILRAVVIDAVITNTATGTACGLAMHLVRLGSHQVAALPQGGRTVVEVLTAASRDADAADRRSGVEVIGPPRRSLWDALRARWRRR
jgi:hypothetical protein